MFFHAINEFRRAFQHAAKRPNGDDRFFVGLGNIHLVRDQVFLFRVQGGQYNDRFAGLDLLDELVLGGFQTATFRHVFRLAGIEVEKAIHALEELEHTKVVGRLPEIVGHKNAYRIVFGHDMLRQARRCT